MNQPFADPAGGGLMPPSPFAPVVAPPSSGWPSKAKGMVAVLVVLLLAAGIGGALLVNGAQSDKDSVQSQLDDANAELRKIKREATGNADDATSAADQVSALQDKVTADEATLAQQKTQLTTQQQQLDADTASITQLTGQVNDAKASATKAQADLASAQADLATAQSALDTSKSDLAAAQANGALLATPFDVDVTTIRPPATNVHVTGNQVACNGFADPGAACPATVTLNATITEVNGQLIFNVPSVVQVGLATLDGFNYVGSAIELQGAGFTCGNTPNPTTFAVTISPTHYTVSPQDQSVVATSVGVTWTESSAAGKCVASGYTYHGFVNL